MVIVPVRLPTVVGVNTVVMVQNAPGARGVGVIGQLLVWVKSPLIANDVINRLAVPELVSLTFSPLLLLPRRILGKPKLLGARVTAGAPCPPQPGNKKLPTAVCQLKEPLAARYSSVNQKVQSSTGSMVIEL